MSAHPNPYAVMLSALNSPPKREPVEVGLTFGVDPLEAWRVFQVASFKHRDTTSEIVLRSLSAQSVWWPRRRCEAFCTAGGFHDAPWQTCTCGLWALRSRDEAVAAAPAFEATSDGYLVAKVALWGRVLEFAKGYRAQYAYPLSMTLFNPWQPSADEIALALSASYGVEVGVECPPQPKPQEVPSPASALSLMLAQQNQSLTAQMRRPIPRGMPASYAAYLAKKYETGSSRPTQPKRLRWWL